MTSLSGDAICGYFTEGRTSRTPLCSTRSSVFLDTFVPWLLSIFVFALPTDLHLSGDISVTLAAGSLCIVIGMLGVIARRILVVLPFGFWCLIAFVIWSTCSLAWAEYPNTAMQKLIKYWEYLPMTWVITQYACGYRPRMRLLAAYVIGCWCGVLGIFFNYAIGREFITPAFYEVGKRYSFGTDANYLALALVIGIPVAFYRASLVRARWTKLIFTAYVPAAFLGMCLTGSRGALLALLGTILTFAVFIDLRKRIALLIGVAALVILIAALPSRFTWRLSTTTDELSHGTLDGRKTLWDEAIPLVAEYPLQGMGVGATEGALHIAAHNTPLEILMEGGLVGLGLFYGGFAYSLYRVWKVAAQERTVLILICVAWFVGTFSLSWDVDFNTWFVFAILLSVGSARKTGYVSYGSSQTLKVVAGAQ